MAPKSEIVAQLFGTTRNWGWTIWWHWVAWNQGGERWHNMVLIWKLVAPMWHKMIITLTDFS
jgi:hypothetical protein